MGTDIASINRQLACATWEAGIPGIGTSVLVTRRTRLLTTVAAFLAAVALIGCAPIGVRYPAARSKPVQWCSDALPGTGTLTICRQSQLECDIEASESQDMGPCVLK